MSFSGSCSQTLNDIHIAQCIIMDKLRDPHRDSHPPNDVHTPWHIIGAQLVLHQEQEETIIPLLTCICH